MLIELFGKNFGCFRDEFRLSMLATDIDPDSQRGVATVKIVDDDQPLRLLRTAAIYGPNASGKSTVLRAASALRFLLKGSAKFASDRPLLGAYTPFQLDKACATSPVSLGMRAVIDGWVHEYFTRFNRRRVIEESLVRSSGRDELILFHRKGQMVEGSWVEDPQFNLLAESFRPNALLLSLADMLTPRLAKDIAVGLRRLLGHYDPTLPHWRRRFVDPVADRAATDDQFAEWLRMRITDVDIGVVDYKAEERKEHPIDEEGPEPSAGEERKKSFRLTLLHDTSEGPVALPESKESKGTRRFLDLTPFFFDVSRRGSCLAFFVDELGASLHPLLLEGLVRHFNCVLSVPDVGGQIVFATHETGLMEGEARDAILRRDQVYFTEKGPDGAARLFSLAEFRERNNLNIRRRYLQGRYGALPSLGEFAEE